MRTRARMALPAVAISLTLLAIGIGAAEYFHVQDQNVSLLLRRLTAQNQAGEEVVLHLTLIRRQLGLFRNESDPVNLQNAYDLDAELWQWLAKADELASIDQQRQWIAQ